MEQGIIYWLETEFCCLIVIWGAKETKMGGDKETVVIGAGQCGNRWGSEKRLLRAGNSMWPSLCSEWSLRPWATVAQLFHLPFPLTLVHSLWLFFLSSKIFFYIQFSCIFLTRSSSLSNTSNLYWCSRLSFSTDYFLALCIPYIALYFVPSCHSSIIPTPF